SGDQCVPLEGTAYPRRWTFDRTRGPRRLGLRPQGRRSHPGRNGVHGRAGYLPPRKGRGSYRRRRRGYEDGFRVPLDRAPLVSRGPGVKFGVLTGGGDCPGLNPAIRAVVRRAAKFGHETVGFLDGWKGVRDDQSRALSVADVADILGKGGTILGSSRTNPFAKETDATRLLETLARHRLGALIAIGGDDTLSAARELHRRGGHVVGVPKTMENDCATPPAATTAPSSSRSWVDTPGGWLSPPVLREEPMSRSFRKNRTTRRRS